LSALVALLVLSNDIGAGADDEGSDGMVVTATDAREYQMPSNKVP